MNKQNMLSRLPAVNAILHHQIIKNLSIHYPETIIKDSIKSVIDLYRIKLLNNEISDNEDIEQLAVQEIVQVVEQEMQSSLTSVINATGIILHTNLGRAKLSIAVKEALNNVAFNYSNLEYDVMQGNRGSRYAHLKEIILDLTEAEDVLVVNNNAAAVLLVLNTLARKKQVIVSRSELVEIGGSFRIPDIIESSGCILKEVGTTNKIYPKDYMQAINPENTAVLLKVHQSNYKIVGFTKEVSIKELVNIGRQNNLPVVADLGSGLLIDMQKFGLPYEPTIKSLIKEGCDIVTFSGDKLLGGPQAGIIVGKKQYIQQMHTNQLTRALRIDKLTMVALIETLKQYYDEDQAIKHIPVLNMLNANMQELQAKAEYFYTNLTKLDLPINVSIQNDYSQIGGGAYPGVDLPSVVIKMYSDIISCNKLEYKLRTSSLHIITRIQQDKIIFDMRTLDFVEIDQIIDTLMKFFN